MDKKLALCPFCGCDRIGCRIETAKSGPLIDSEYIWVQCYRCNARGPHSWVFGKEEEATEYAFKQWNERTDWVTGKEITGNKETDTHDQGANSVFFC